MINITSALSLARTKFKNRRIRQFFSGFAVALGVTVMLALLFATQGLLTATRTLFVDTTAHRSFAIQGVSADELSSFAPEKYRAANADYRINAVFLQRIIRQSKFGLKNFVNEQTLSQLEIRSIDAPFVRDFLADGSLFDERADDKIPVVVPKRLVLEQEYPNYKSLGEKAKYELGQKAIAKYTGKEVELTTEDQAATGIHLVIVGFSSSSIFSTSDLFLTSEALLLPNWAFEKNSDVKKLLDGAQLEGNIITEFKTKSERNEFLKEKNKNFNAFSATNLSNASLQGGPLVALDGRYDMFTDAINGFKQTGYGVGGFFLAIAALFVLTTVGKIVGDSKKEIGLFRAVGATKSDIYKIVITYALIIVNIGFLLGCGFALAVTEFASRTWGADLFYLLLDFSSAASPTLPKHLFVSVPVLSLAGVWLVVNAVGAIACVWPGYKAAKVDPAKVLKEE